ncbi:hypothetical protein EIKCOROL_01330 [Eikenella corrodens ATCC 23834]|uniref:Uncharacterized protein n=1 Tax=Eikenella corrodens ATCC 23834 TaxID=546274 RepID=C0DVE0_EIKCO|nr:hypothetical protein EIKCOROL_01330 [Eikenella corrodens ATCC 23834]
MLFARAHGGAQNRIFAMGNRFHFDYGQGGLGIAGIAGEFRHGLAGVAVLIFAHAHIGQQFAFNHHFGMGDGAFVDGEAFGHFHSVAAQRAGNAQFVEAQRRGGRLEAGGDFNGGIHADADGNRQRFAGGFGFLAEGVDVAAGGKPHGKLVFALHAQAVDGDVRFAGFWVGGIAQTHREIRAGVFHGVGGCGQQGAQVEIGIAG